MTRAAHGASRIGLVLVLVGLASAASAVDNTYYREISRDGQVYVFNDGQKLARFETTGEMESAIVRVGAGKNGETLVADSERALELYFLKHGISEPATQPRPDSPAARSWRIHGLVFGDYYWFARHHDPVWDGQQGFWLRRAYLGYDQSFGSALSMRLRLEMNSNGQLSGGDLEPYVKDAYLTWTFAGKQQLRAGIQPSLTFDVEEEFWGLRHIEKTPADLYRIDGSRDFGITVSGPLLMEGLTYAAQFGNESGNGSETDEHKIVRFFGGYDRDPGLHAEAVFNYGSRPDGEDRATAKGLAGFRGNLFAGDPADPGGVGAAAVTNTVGYPGFEAETYHIFSAPDGLAFDPQGWLWIETDYSPSLTGVQTNMGNCHMLLADVPTGRIGRFLTGPNGCEITGWTMTPDRKSLFINIQHPGEGGATIPSHFSTWPDGSPPARSSTIVITKDDGGVIGT